MFKATITGQGWDEAIEGESLPGEDWEATLLRLYHQKVPDGQRRRVPRMWMVSRDGSMRVTMGFEDRFTSTVMTDPPVILKTDPPQWRPNA
jgi:hypothetical protein